MTKLGSRAVKGRSHLWAVGKGTIALRDHKTKAGSRGCMQLSNGFCFAEELSMRCVWELLASARLNRA
jgi:hypothetical protein